MIESVMIDSVSTWGEASTKSHLPSASQRAMSQPTPRMLRRMSSAGASKLTNTPAWPGRSSSQMRRKLATARWEREVLPVTYSLSTYQVMGGWPASGQRVTAAGGARLLSDLWPGASPWGGGPDEEGLRCRRSAAVG